MISKQKRCMFVRLPILITVVFALCVPSMVMAFSAEQKSMIEAAKKEGELTWIDSIVVPPNAKAMEKAFKEYYGLPESFKINHQRKGTGPTATLVAQEVQSGRVTIDLFGAAAPELFSDLKKAGALLEYQSAEYANFSKAQEVGLPYSEGYYQSAVAYCFAPITNPKVFKRKITSWYDLLAPDLKGKKIMFPAVAKGGSPLSTYYGLRQILPKSFFEELVKQEIIFDRGSSVDATQRLTQGEVIVTITNPFRIVQTAQTSGVELEAHFPNKEGIVLLGQPYGILKDAPHPNAAKLFIDFLFSETGIQNYIDLEKIISIRNGMEVPEDIKKFSPPIGDLNVIAIDWEKVDLATLTKYKEEFAEIFQN